MVDKFKKLYNRKLEAQIDSALQQGVKRITDHLILNDDETEQMRDIEPSDLNAESPQPSARSTSLSPQK